MMKRWVCRAAYVTPLMIHPRPKVMREIMLDRRELEAAQREREREKEREERETTSRAGENGASSIIARPSRVFRP